MAAIIYIVWIAYAPDALAAISQILCTLSSAAVLLVVTIVHMCQLNGQLTAARLTLALLDICSSSEHMCPVLLMSGDRLS